MRTSVVIFLLLLALILEAECTPRKGRYRYGHRRLRRQNCSPYRKRDCLVTMWSAWCRCSHECGSSGVRSRTRNVIMPAKCGGKPCPTLRGEEPCNRMCHNGGIPQPNYCKCLPGYTGKCCEKGNGQGTTDFCASKPDGVYPYPKDCGSFYHCSNGITYIKKCPGQLRWNKKAKSCDWPQHVNCGQVHGGWSAWGKWNKCSKPCDGGYQIRVRFCNKPKPHHDQTRCVGNTIESRACNTQSCSIQGGWSAWGKWNTCSKTCGVGYQIRVRFCSNPKPHPVNDQTDCKGNRLQTSTCNTQSCSYNCAWENWSKWSKCSAACGCGSHKRTRQCKCNHGNGYKKISYHGNHCYGNSVEHGKCNCQECPGPHVKTVPKGCFLDKNAPNRALPDFVANFYGETTAFHRIDACAHLANKLKVKYFGMQDEGECWVDLNGVNHYDKHGTSTNCKDGIGGDWANYVYKIVS